MDHDANQNQQLATRLAAGTRSMSRDDFQLALSHAFGGDITSFREALDRLREGVVLTAEEARRLLTLARHAGLPKHEDARLLLRPLWLAAEGSAAAITRA
jgi:hypothetical protein